MSIWSDYEDSMMKKEAQELGDFEKELDEDLKNVPSVLPEDAAQVQLETDEPEEIIEEKIKVVIDEPRSKLEVGDVPLLRKMRMNSMTQTINTLGQTNVAKAIDRSISYKRQRVCASAEPYTTHDGQDKIAFKLYHYAKTNWVNLAQQDQAARALAIVDADPQFKRDIDPQVYNILKMFQTDPKFKKAADELQEELFKHAGFFPTAKDLDKYHQSPVLPMDLAKMGFDEEEKERLLKSFKKAISVEKINASKLDSPEELQDAYSRALKHFTPEDRNKLDFLLEIQEFPGVLPSWYPVFQSAQVPITRTTTPSSQLLTPDLFELIPDTPQYYRLRRPTIDNIGSLRRIAEDLILTKRLKPGGRNVGEWGLQGQPGYVMYVVDRRTPMQIADRLYTDLDVPSGGDLKEKYQQLFTNLYDQIYAGEYDGYLSASAVPKKLMKELQAFAKSKDMFLKKRDIADPRNLTEQDQKYLDHLAKMVDMAMKENSTSGKNIKGYYDRLQNIPDLPAALGVDTTYQEHEEKKKKSFSQYDRIVEAQVAVGNPVIMDRFGHFYEDIGRAFDNNADVYDAYVGQEVNSLNRASLAPLLEVANTIDQQIAMAEVSDVSQKVLSQLINIADKCDEQGHEDVADKITEIIRTNTNVD